MSFNEKEPNECRDNKRIKDKQYESFLLTLTNSNTKKVAKSYVGIAACMNYTEEGIKQTIISMRPNSQKAIITICYIWRYYAEFLGEERLLQLLQTIDTWSLWQEAKPFATSKFLSHADYQEACQLIHKQVELLNPRYYETLFRCLYEGIYNEDMSVLKNLRASDVVNDTVTLREDNGDTYQIQIPKDLAIRLMELPDEPFMRRNRQSIFEVPVEGEYFDSCFKVEQRSGSVDDRYKYSYYRVLRAITNNYMGRKRHAPLQIFVSGITHRICEKLRNSGISIEYAFGEHNRDRRVKQIIEEELLRCNYKTSVKNFRQMVKGHVDVFID